MLVRIAGSSVNGRPIHINCGTDEQVTPTGVDGSFSLVGNWNFKCFCLYHKICKDGQYESLGSYILAWAAIMDAMFCSIAESEQI